MMKQHEREYFISRIRSGIYKLDFKEVTLRLISPTIEQELEINQVYSQTYSKAEKDGIMCHEDLLKWMKQRGLWTQEDEDKEKSLEKDIERFKVELFYAKNQEGKRNQIRRILKAGKEQLSNHTAKKFENYENTCEGIASAEKVSAMLKLCTFTKDNELFDFVSVPVEHVLKLYGLQVLSEVSIRELARNDPWRNVWLLKDSNSYNLFANKDTELNADQRHILLWSRMYDNVQESMDCPSDDVIQDDDMLDGWFIIQKKKQDKQKAEADIAESTQNSKIANSDEIFVMAQSKDDAERINSTNTYQSQKVKEQRMSVIKERGEAADLDFLDQKLKLRQQSNEQYKGKFRR